MISKSTNENKIVYVTRSAGNIDRVRLDRINEKLGMAFFKPKNGVPVAPAELDICFLSLKKALKHLIVEYEQVVDDLLETLKYYRKLVKNDKEKDALRLGHFNLVGWKVPPVEEQV